MGERVVIFDTPVDKLTMAEALDRIDQFTKERKPHLIIAINPEKIMRVREDLVLQKILQEAELTIADGIGLVWAARLLGNPLQQRVTGFDLMQEIVKAAAPKGYKLFFLGAAPGVAQQAKEVYLTKYPALQVVGVRDGYFKAEEEEALIDQINSSGADVLFVAMGTPKQEKWLAKYRSRLQIPVCMGVGGSFDVVAGRIQRAPLFMQRLGLEWLHRFLKEPSRIGRMGALPKFALAIIKHKFSLKG